MICQIENELLKIEANTLGAELMSIRTVKDNLEYLWQGDPKYWERRSPTLFPVVGVLNGGKYKLNGLEYELEPHGFAKTSEFELVKKTSDSMTFRLVENELTLKKYPFKFELDTTYRLKGNVLSIDHRITNRNECDMWFSIGEHPGFKCPLLDGETMEDYVLEFEQDEHVKRRFLKDGLLNGREVLFLENEKVIKLSHALFDQLAIVLTGMKSKSVALKNCKDNRKVTVTLEGYPYLGIWSPVGDAPFVCIEPWHGVASSVDGTSSLSEKEGIIQLSSDREFACEYRIMIDIYCISQIKTT